MARLSPDYDRSGLVNLIGTIERHLTGSAPMPSVADSRLPAHPGYVLVIFDGLGSHQLDDPSAADLSLSHRGDLTAGFPTMTTTSMATVATGLPPGRHGLIGHLMHLPGVAEVVNVLQWITPAGKPVDHDYAAMLPEPNLWERLSAAGLEPITVQPGAYTGTPLSRLLYRGCRFEQVWTIDEIAEATVAVAGPGRLVMTYFPNVDITAHVSGRHSNAYREAVGAASGLWEDLVRRLPGEIGLVGTADHGHVDYQAGDKIVIRDRRYDALRLYGDPRSVYVSGRIDLIGELATETGADLLSRSELVALLGPGPHHPALDERLPDRLLLAPRGKVLLPKPFDKRLIGYHGGLEPEELMIPLLVRD